MGPLSENEYFASQFDLIHSINNNVLKSYFSDQLSAYYGTPGHTSLSKANCRQSSNSIEMKSFHQLSPSATTNHNASTKRHQLRHLKVPNQKQSGRESSFYKSIKRVSSSEAKLS